MASIYKIASGWRAQVRGKNQLGRSKVFPTKAEAVQWSRGGPAQPTFSSILAAYREISRPGGMTKQLSLARLEAYWGAYRPREIDSGAVSTFARQRRREAGPASVLMDLVYLSVVLKHGGVILGCDDALLAREKVSSTITTLRHLGVAGESNERSRRPSDEELRMLLAHFAARPRSVIPMADIVLWALTTCCRLGEICGAGAVQWEDLDQKNRLVLIRGRKHPRKPGGTDDLLPLLTGVVTVGGNPIDPLEVALRQPTREGPVFPHATGTVSDGFARAVRELKIEDLHFHDLRHDGISRLFEAGFGIPQVAAVSGHRSWKHLQRYTHLRPDKLQPDSLRRE